MAFIPRALVNAAYDRVFNSFIHESDIDKRYELRKNTILADKSLTNDEKSEIIRILNKNYDHYKILFNEGKKRLCENCKKRMSCSIIL